MSWDTVSLRLKEIMQSVDGVYNVHRYFRDIPDEAKFLEAFSVDLDGQTLLTGWMMTRKGIEATRPNTDANATLDLNYKIEIQGILALDDPGQSELLFQKAIDGIMTKMKGKYLLESDAGLSLSGIVLTSEMRVDEIGHGQFSNIFVHFCRMGLSVTERI